MQTAEKNIFIDYTIKSIKNRVPSISHDQSLIVLSGVYNDFKERYNMLSSSIVSIPSGKIIYTHAMGMAHVWRELSRILYIQNTEECSQLSECVFMILRLDYGLDLYPKTELGEIYCLAHGAYGSVLVNTKYGENIVIFNNVTVGRVEGFTPIIGDNVILYPGSGVYGSSYIGNGSIVSAGTIVSNKIVPENVIVFNGNDGGLIFKRRKKNYIYQYLS